jgi:hypothetical protein
LPLSSQHQQPTYRLNRCLPGPTKSKLRGSGETPLSLPEHSPINPRRNGPRFSDSQWMIVEPDFSEMRRKMYAEGLNGIVSDPEVCFPDKTQFGCGNRMRGGGRDRDAHLLPYPGDAKSSEFQRLMDTIHETIATRTLPDHRLSRHPRRANLFPRSQANGVHPACHLRSNSRIDFHPLRRPANSHALPHNNPEKF